ncbi:aldo/keto reductase [Limosilactobacillus sp. STM2_1]|uniref:Aldo/keto reductase n=1 Tax=Limosilactobacillus rudii TaxID=2759755 RepID=A0A7W3UJ83_9LACO|nr:aldo/keto reductase [Limosilactobacillus rudii]MBB1078474.1 aldo/keto reductase [Limosilactobacillus rudii]MBB1096604.1 aldo/keto reductase [Limosilactobacillus rudii]MCD7134200.1 aldo/keto reductase [Limosilactobacillus rudii]
MILDETITLNSGVAIPKFALGTWLVDDNKVTEAVRNAIKIGYRHIDTAQAYGNERGVGEGVRTADIDRDQIFVTSKIAAEHKDYDVTKKSIDETLRKMGLNYIDMMIIHSPQPWKEVNQSDNRYLEGNLAAWRAMEDAVSEGKIRTIGVSNFNESDLENIIKNSETVPAVDQVLAHIGHTPFNLLSFARNYNIAIEAYSPVAHGAALDNPVITKMAQKYNVSVPQLCIRYDWQLGMIVLPKTANPQHMKENAEIDFEISEEDMDELRRVKPLDYGDADVFPVYGGKM